MFFGRKKREAALAALVDELGDTRAQLRVLRLREAALLEDIATYKPAPYVRAARHEMETKRIKERFFARKTLPQYIQDDPRHWRSTWKELCVVTPLDSSQMAGSVAQTYADAPLDLPPEEINYGQPLRPDPGSIAREHEPSALREVAETAPEFDWHHAPHHGSPQKRK